MSLRSVRSRNNLNDLNKSGKAFLFWFLITVPIIYLSCNPYVFLICSLFNGLRSEDTAGGASDKTSSLLKVSLIKVSLDQSLYANTVSHLE